MKISRRTKLLTTSLIIVAAQATVASATPQLDPTRTGQNYGVSSVTQVGNNTNVVQNQNRALLNWRTIDTNSQESLNFQQPSSNSVILNKITSGQQTQFLGHLNANGKVVIENDAGMTFAAGSQINVGALVATTGTSITNYTGKPIDWNDKFVGPLQPSDQDYVVSGVNQGKINFQGNVNANNGYILAIGKHIYVAPTATLQANNGKIGLYAGYNSMIVNGRAGYTKDNGTATAHKASVDVQGSLIAHNGRIALRSQSSDVADAAMNVSGIVDVSSLAPTTPTLLGSNLGYRQESGKIRISSTGDVNISGHLNANGNKLNVANAAQATGTSTSTATPSDTIKIRAGRDINDTGTISASSANGTNRVRLQAGRDANINGNVKATGNASSLLNISSGGNTNIGGGLQVGNGTARIVSDGTTTVNGYIDAQGNNDNALPSRSPSDNGGTISINANSDIIANGYIDAGSLRGNAGTVVLNAKGNVTTNTKIAGGAIGIFAAKDLVVNNPHGDDYITAYNGGYNTGPGNGGYLTLGAGGSATINALLSAGNINGGGKVTIGAGGPLVLNGAIVNSSANGSGGEVNISSSTSIASHANIYTNGAVNGGNITLTTPNFAKDPDAVYTTYGAGQSGTVTLNGTPL